MQAVTSVKHSTTLMIFRCKFLKTIRCIQTGEIREEYYQGFYSGFNVRAIFSLLSLKRNTEVD